MIESRPRPAVILDAVAAGFARLLRLHGVAVSPAETIEIRRVLALVGARDLDMLRAALRATCAKYQHEQAPFDLVFDAMFVGAATAESDEVRNHPRAQVSSGALPDEFEISDDADLGKYADYNERAAEVGDHFDTPEKEKGFNPHKDDDDLSITGGDTELSVDSQAESGKRGVEFTVDVDRAATANAGALSEGSTIASESAMSWDDPRGILDWLDSYDARSIYATSDDGEIPTQEQIERMLAAVENFIAALAERTAASGVSGPPSGRLRTDTGPSRWEIEEGCREVLRRMRGAHRPKPRRTGHGRLDMRRTSRAGMRTDGVPFELRVMQPHPEPVRLLILADVSLSVRPITAFTLRLAQTMRRRSRRATVLAFVDRPVEVTDILSASTGDDALAEVLSSPELDLEGSSDYGKMLTEVLGRYGDYVTRRTSVLIVGDGRSNGLDPKVDAMEELARKVHRVAWVTPEQERYWSQAMCAMGDYAEHCDAVVVARDAHELIARAPLLGSALR